MKKINYVLVVFLFGFSLIQSVFASQIFNDFKNNLGDIIKDVCHSSINYSIDDSVGFSFENNTNISLKETVCKSGKCAEYHEKMNCLFNNGLKKIVQNANNRIVSLEVFGENAQGLPFRAELENKLLSHTEIGRCEEDIIQAQKARGFVSRCRDLGIKNSAEEGSACQITEAALLEYCGYEKFLLAKSKDKESFIKEFGDFKEITEETPAIAKIVYQQEIKNTKQSLTEMLDFYQNFEYSYKINTWLESFWFQMGLLLKELSNFINGIATFPESLPNNSINAS